MLKTRFDSEKALEAILYVASKAPIPDIYHVGKILYFADRLHLDRFGRLITGDNYKAMKDGPVAENGYDIIKIAQGKGKYVPNGIDVADILSALKVFDKPESYKVQPLREYDDGVFSDSDLSCIDESIQRYGEMTFWQIREISHDDIWSSSSENGDIALEALVSKCSDSDKLLKHLTNGF